MKGGGVILACCAIVIAGCSSLGSLTGAVTGAVAGGGSANPAVGYAVGIGSKAAVDALVAYLSRQRQRSQQDKLAKAAGDLALGSTTSWSIRHKAPLFDNAHGQVTAIREIPSPLAPCREVTFTVLTGKKETIAGRFTTTLCQSEGVWRWAEAEPAIQRWGFLQ